MAEEGSLYLLCPVRALDIFRDLLREERQISCFPHPSRPSITGSGYFPGLSGMQFAFTFGCEGSLYQRHGVP